MITQTNRFRFEAEGFVALTLQKAERRKNSISVSQGFVATDQGDH